MYTTKTSIDHLFCIDAQYQVPLYQRRYVWNQANWSALWNDIRSQVDSQLNGGDSRHFVGAIVTRPIKSGRLSKFEIIDGQQRLATFQIILCAIRDIYQSDGYTEITQKIKSLVLNSEMAIAGDTPDALYKFLPTSADKEAFDSIVRGQQTENGHHLMLQAYAYFKAQIAAYVTGDKEQINELLFSIVHDFVVVQIILDSSDVAENIFASINTGGRQLSEFDLLRNNLFLRAGNDSDRLHHMYLEYWAHFEEDPFWTPETLNQFLRDFLTAKLGIEIETGDLFELYDRHYRSTLEASQGVEHELAELKQHAEIYRRKIERDV